MASMGEIFTPVPPSYRTVVMFAIKALSQYIVVLSKTSALLILKLYEYRTGDNLRSICTFISINPGITD